MSHVCYVTATGSAQSQVAESGLGGSDDDATTGAAAASDGVEGNATTMVIIGVVATAVNILLLIGLGLVCLRHRNSHHKDLDNFLAQEEAAAAASRRKSSPLPPPFATPYQQPASSVLPPPSSSVAQQPVRLDSCENQSFDIYASEGEH